MDIPHLRDVCLDGQGNVFYLHRVVGNYIEKAKAISGRKYGCSSLPKLREQMGEQIDVKIKYRHPRPILQLEARLGSY